MIYNVVRWSYVSAELLTRIVTEIDGVIGVKQSGGNTHALAELLLRMEGRGLVMAALDDLLYPCFVLGADRAIAAILTVAPQLCLELWQAVQAGQHAKARSLHERLLRIWLALVGSNVPARAKAGMTMQGRIVGLPRPPMLPASEAEAAIVRSALQASQCL